ncbi:release factor glutamine methyltransferase [Mariniphaga anaerophila]|uniref:Release factor glutamine methyltransferase n=1 Tax=Mariniphaga anaerophila TaxID=1484053 RepID=A0A1M5CDW0_9BACT|nr:peptide chain release factor N(5)-glutamine methyltransferase [Mariniphaga anaerophila]SHF52787.1 release factor glutamine methyltransferase [Mariniphaga anaerophila]
MKATIQYIGEELGGLYPQTEVKAFTRLILEHVCGLDYTAQILMRDHVISAIQSKQISEIVTRLKNFEPIQYVFGETEFFGMKLSVNPSVLIPRPETEELLHWISEMEFSKEPCFLDVGTGSGCIALGLKKQFPYSNVMAIDYSDEALETARENAVLNGLDVSFSRADILKWEERSWQNFDLIVSNPPYVRESEKKEMFANVLKFEPESALFVPDSNPLLFYLRIAEFAQKFLTKNGWLYFEINEMFGEQTAQVVKKCGFEAIEIKKDLFGKDRMLRCRK